MNPSTPVESPERPAPASLAAPLAQALALTDLSPRDRAVAKSLVRQWTRGFGRPSGASKARSEHARMLAAVSQALDDMAAGRYCIGVQAAPKDSR